VHRRCFATRLGSWRSSEHSGFIVFPHWEATIEATVTLSEVGEGTEFSNLAATRAST